MQYSNCKCSLLRFFFVFFLLTVSCHVVSCYEIVSRNVTANGSHLENGTNFEFMSECRFLTDSHALKRSRFSRLCAKHSILRSTFFSVSVRVSCELWAQLAIEIFVSAGAPWFLTVVFVGVQNADTKNVPYFTIFCKFSYKALRYDFCFVFVFDRIYFKGFYWIFLVFCI